MALKTLGTNANNSLTAFIVGTNDVIAADLAQLNVQLRLDPRVGTTRARINQPYTKKGRLFIPNRGELILYDGDYICWDATSGWPIVVSADAAANGPYTHS